MVGVGNFEIPALRSQSGCSTSELHPDIWLPANGSNVDDLIQSQASCQLDEQGAWLIFGSGLGSRTLISGVNSTALYR
jgi:hypothetical protein